MMDVLPLDGDRLRCKAEMVEETSSAELFCRADQPSAEPGRPEIAPRSVADSNLSREMRWHHVGYRTRIKLHEIVHIWSEALHVLILHSRASATTRAFQSLRRAGEVAVNHQPGIQIY